MRDEALWGRLTNYAFAVDDTPATFARRLAREEGWSEKFAVRVIEEYKRFLYLTQVADSEATPSWRIDRAWHLHLTHSRDYWDRLCPDVLGKPLHHDPGAGEADAVRHAAQYDSTRALYLDEFGTPPPARIWRPRWHDTVAKISGAVLVLGVLLLLGGPVLEQNQPTAIVAGLAMIFAGGVSWSIYRDPEKRKSTDLRRSCGGGGGCGGGCGGS